MTRLSCREARKALHSYHDGELEMGRMVAVERHLGRCAACARERERLRLLRATIRSAARRRRIEPDEGLLDAVLSRARIERAQALGARVGVALEDLHFVWASVGAVAAVALCLIAATGALRRASMGEPASMAALLADPGSNENPAVPDIRMALPRPDPARVPEPPAWASLDDLITLAAVVTREGELRNVEVLGARGRMPARQSPAVRGLVDAASRVRFEPARARGEVVAVNMVWLFAHTRVVGRDGLDLWEVPPGQPRPAPRPAVRTPGPVSRHAPAGSGLET